MYRWSFVIIQWPAHVCHPYVVHSNLLWNSQSNFNQTSRKCSLRWPSSKLAQRFNFIYTFHGIYQRVQCKAIVTSSFTFFYRRRGKKCFVIPQKNKVLGGIKESLCLSEAIFCPAYFLQTTGRNPIQLYMKLLYQEEICIPFKKESAVVEWLASGISKPGVPGSIPSRGTTVMVECPWARHIF